MPPMHDLKKPIPATPLTNYLKALSAMSVIIAVTIWVFSNYLHKHDPPVYSIPKQVRYSYTLQNRTNQLIKAVEFKTYAPVKLTATQRCDKIQASHPYKFEQDALGNQILTFSLKNIPPHDVRIINIKAQLMMAVKPNYLEINHVQTFLEPEKYIESDHPEILKAAQALKNKNTTTCIDNTFFKVAGSIRYVGHITQARGALYALREKKGDCTEYMSLFTALCRANQIPARGIAGYLVRGNSVAKSSDFHNWSEFYNENKWQLADPQNNILMKNQADYVAIRIINEKPENKLSNFNQAQVDKKGILVKMNLL